MALGETIYVRRRDVGQVVPMYDNGDGSHSERVIASAIPDVAPTIVTLNGNSAPAPGSGATFAAFAIPNDGKVYWVTALWAQIGPGTSVADNTVIQIENANSGAVLAILLQAVRQSTGFYSTVAWSGMVPIAFGQRIIARYLIGGSAAVATAASAVLMAY